MKLLGQYQLAQPRGLQAINQPVVCDSDRFLSLEQIHAAEGTPWNIALDGEWLINSFYASGTTAGGRRR